MNAYREFIMTALGEAPGFGPPKKSTRKPPTKEQMANWRARSAENQAAYLKKYPNSRYKDVPARGSVLTRSKKLSNSTSAKAMVAAGTDFLKGLGVRNKGRNKEHAKSVYKNLNEFLDSKVRKPYVDKGVDTFRKFFNKLPPEHQKEAEKEATSIINQPTRRPSRALEGKGAKGALPALIGLAIGAALCGALVTGFLPADVFVFLGVKALDTAIESIRHTTQGAGGAMAIAAACIGGFFKSKDSDDYAEDVKEKMRKNDPDVAEETNETPTPNVKTDGTDTATPATVTPSEVKPEVSTETKKAVT